MKKKKDKKKVTYYDDGRTIVDMSALRGGGLETDKNNFVRPRSTMKDKWKTYIEAVKSMLLPMFITLASITIVFFLAYLILGGFKL